jgi:cell division protein FtsI (penicillin-binding protein 3)
VGWVYEPGSTFKLVTLSAALEEGLTSPQDVINCQRGSIVLAGHTIHDHKPFGYLTVENVLAMSSDVGAIKLGLRLGEERFHRWIGNFGFASRTGVDLPGEERGLLRPPDRWSGISIGEMSIGQEVAVTPLQLATAYSAIANGGILFHPRIVRDVFLGNMHDRLPPASGRRVVSQQTSSLMKQMLEQVLQVGTGVPARLNGYSAAGKTGTAQKIDESGHYSKSHYISSFVGFAPLDRPAITILVVIDSPVGAIYGSEVAAPVFRSIAEQTLGYLNVPLDNPSKWPQVVSSTPTRSSQPHRGDEVDFPPNEPEPPAAATSPVRLASFSSASSAGRRSQAPVDGPLLNVPDFMAQPEREVAEKSQELGLELSISGTGLAAEQAPPAGARVPAGSRVWVRFRR